jgi:muramoyltetrapeptide carboxypeptidase LdcA involved in peptidoglycan recycling
MNFKYNFCVNNTDVPVFANLKFGHRDSELQRAAAIPMAGRAGVAD